MTARAERNCRPELADILREPTTPAAFLGVVRDRIMRRQQQERRAPRETTALIRQQLPDLVARTIADADRALAGRLVLPGTGARPYFVGDPPDWFANPVNDREYLWVLNRMGHWPPLLAAFSLTQDRRYAEKVIQELRDWIARCPRPPIERDPERARAAFRSVTPWRLLETGIRMFNSWPMVLEHLIDSELLTPGLLGEYAVALYEHGEALADVSPILFPHANHNMHIMQNLGLLAVACLLPEFERAPAWREQAMRELERAARVQLTDDGGQIEGCPHYHNVCVHFLAQAQLVAATSGERFSDGYAERVLQGLTYSVHAFRPSGTGVPWGDSDADRRAVTAALFGGLAFGRWEPFRQLVELAGREAAREERLKSIWQVPAPRDWLGDFEALCDSPPVELPTVSWQRGLQQVALRTDWGRDALSLFFACYTPNRGTGHSHLDPMGFDFTALGRPLIVDPGRFTYREDADRRAFKSAAWHNTLTIDHADPYAYISSWVNGPQKPGDVIRVQQTDGLLAAEAMHENYEPAIHRRAAAIVDGAFLLVLDEVRDLEPGRSVQIYYHVDSAEVVWHQTLHAAFTHNPDVNVAIFTTANLRGALRDGRVSDFLDIARPSRRLCLEDATQDGTHRAYAAVIVPYRATDPVPSVSGLRLDRQGQGLICSFELGQRPYSLAWDSSGLAQMAISRSL